MYFVFPKEFVYGLGFFSFLKFKPFVQISLRHHISGPALKFPCLLCHSEVLLFHNVFTHRAWNDLLFVFSSFSVLFLVLNQENSGVSSSNRGSDFQ